MEVPITHVGVEQMTQAVVSGVTSTYTYAGSSRPKWGQM